MASFMEKQISKFIARIDKEAVVKREGGQVQINSLALLKIVRDDREVAELVVKSYCLLARKDPALYQLAISVAAAYQVAFGESTLVAYVEKQAGDNPIMIGFKEKDGEVRREDVTGYGDPGLRIIEIEGEEVENGDISNFARMFHDLERQSARVILLQGRVAFEFSSYAKDTRPDFLIPAISVFLRKIDAEFPHFLYYIVPESEFSQAMIYTMSLLPAEDFEIIPGSWIYHGKGEVFCELLAIRLRAVAQFSSRVGSNGDTIVSALLANFSEHVRNSVAAILQPRLQARAR
jgi:hypothetical protein